MIYASTLHEIESAQEFHGDEDAAETCGVCGGQCQRTDEWRLAYSPHSLVADVAVGECCQDYGELSEEAEERWRKQCERKVA